MFCLSAVWSQEFPPVTLRIVERTWTLPDKLPIGSFVYKATVGSDPYNRHIIYGLEPKVSPSGSYDPVPLEIDPDSGDIFVNDTLTDKVKTQANLPVLSV